MRGLSLFAVSACVLIAVVLAKPIFDDRIKKRWAFFANNDDNLRTIPSDCDEIVQEYSDGKLVMYEYKIKMARCLKSKGESKSLITSKYEDDDSSESFFRKALKFTEDNDNDSDDKDTKKDDYHDDKDTKKNDYNDEDDQQDKKSVVPQSDIMNVQNSMDMNSVPQQQSASYYPSQVQDNMNQAQAPAQTEAAFTQNTVYNQAAPAQQEYNYYTRSNIPAAPQAQNVNQWNAPNVVPAQPQVDATKKDSVPAAPSNDPFAQFMNIQSSPDTAPQATQQRSEIPLAQPQAPQTYNMPTNQQAYFIDQVRAWSPEDDGIFPENP